MREKLQIVNGNWWFLHGSHWKPLIDAPSSMTRDEVKLKAADQMQRFREECEENKKLRYVESR